MRHSLEDSQGKVINLIEIAPGASYPLEPGLRLVADTRGEKVMPVRSVAPPTRLKALEARLAVLEGKA